MLRIIPAIALGALMTAVFSAAAVAEPDTGEPNGEAALQRSIEQLRDSVGKWDTVTRFLNPDGSVAREVTGTYEFHWIVPDRVVAGKSAIPKLGSTAGILFYVNEARGVIEMVSVGADGRLWVMTGPLGGETRTTRPYPTATGTAMMRFTRFNVAADSFESRMEYTEDEGKTWKPGNHQTFRRTAP